MHRPFSTTTTAFFFSFSFRPIRLPILVRGRTQGAAGDIAGSCCCCLLLLLLFLLLLLLLLLLLRWWWWWSRALEPSPDCAIIQPPGANSSASTTSQLAESQRP